MLYEDPQETFISDPGYVADVTPYVVAASSELPCPSCLTGLMQVIRECWFHGADEDESFKCDAFRCRDCDRRVLIERRAT